MSVLATIPQLRPQEGPMFKIAGFKRLLVVLLAATALLALSLIHI